MYNIKKGDVIIQESINLQNDLATRRGETKRVNIYIENNDLHTKVYNCHTCGIQIHNRSLFTMHFKSEWHNYNLKRKGKNLESVDELTYIENMKRLDKLKEELNNTKKQNKSNQEAHKKDKKDKNKNKKKEILKNPLENNSEINESELDKEEPNQVLCARNKKELLKDFVKYDNPKVCFFDDRLFDSMEENLKHMNKEYTFFFPSEKYIVNMKKIILNTGRAIYEGCICIFCFKQFKSVYAAQTHMIALGHTKMDDRFFDYIRKYYDFSKSYLEILNKHIHSKEDKKEMLMMLQSGAKEKQTQNLQVLFGEEINEEEAAKKEKTEEEMKPIKQDSYLKNHNNSEIVKVEGDTEEIRSFNDEDDEDDTNSEDYKITEEEFNSNISIEVIQETLEHFGFSKCYINEYGNLVLPDGSEAIHKSLAYIFKQNLTFSRMPKTQQLQPIKNEKVKSKTPKHFNRFNTPDKRYERIMKMLVKRIKRSTKKDSVAFI